MEPNPYEPPRIEIEVKPERSSRFVASFVGFVVAVVYLMLALVLGVGGGFLLSIPLVGGKTDSRWGVLMVICVVVCTVLATVRAYYAAKKLEQFDDRKRNGGELK